MKLTDITRYKKDIAEQVVLENLGNLSQLNLGSLVNVLKQSGGSNNRRGAWTGPIGNKFTSQTIGSTSEILDIGVIKDGIKTIRKAYRANDTASAFALYIGGHAVLFAVFDDYAIAGSSRTGRLAYDLTKFQDVISQMDDEERSSKPEWQQRSFQTTKTTSYREKERSDWEKQRYGKTTPERFQGDSTSTGNLATVIDMVMTVGKRAGQPVTGKLVLRDQAAQKLRSDRYFTKQDITAGYKDLRTRLAFYKNSKRPTVNSIQDFVKASIEKQGKQVRFAGITYILKSSSYDKIDPSALLSGKSFDVSYSSSDPGIYDSVKITYAFDKSNNMLLPVFATWYDKTDAANPHNRQEAVLDPVMHVKMKLGVANLDDKTNVLKKLIEVIKAHKYKEVLAYVEGLKKLGKDWPELDTIQKSAQIEIDKKQPTT